MNRTRHASQLLGRRSDGRSRRSNRQPARDNVQRIPLAESGAPGAVPGAAPPSPAVATTDASRAKYPWLPARVIAGSVWKGPGQERVKVDEGGVASPWPPARP